MPRPLIRSTRHRKARSTWLPESLRDFLLRAFRTLISYNASDPSLNAAASEHAVQNWLGLLGSYGADILWQSVGLGGFVIVIVLAAWGWRVASDRPLDLLIWRVIAIGVAMLAVSVGLAALSVTLPFTAVHIGGAVGKVLGGALINLTNISIARYVIAPFILIAAVVSIYIAAALSLEEWHVMAQLIHQFIWWLMRQAHYVGVSILHILRNDKTGARDDEEEEETEEENDEPEEAEKDDEAAPEGVSAAEKRALTVRSRVKAPLVKRPAASARQARLALQSEGENPLPPLDLLQWPDAGKQTTTISEEALEKNAKLLESVLSDFGVNGAISKVSPGPVVTLYELEPAPGTRASRVVSLADDIARNMSVTSVRVATVPGRNVIGIEMPNARRETVYLRELLQSDQYNDTRATLPLVLGKDIAGQAVIADLARMPHLLIAGTTGSGKSVAINTMILSLLYRMPPQKCRFIMIDPKMLELSVYEGIPHLLAPVVTEPKKAIMALRWTVREMEERYRAMSKLGVRNIDGYNMRLREAMKNGENLMRTVQTGFDRDTGKPIYEEQPLDLTELPYIVVIVDEMADLMIVAGKEIEGAIQRLAQMARAAGIHIMMATQRPSVDVITGTIKANFPTRISFQVTSKIDSRTILGEQGAEQLLGQGDMLYMAGGGRVTRVHGPFVRDDEVESIVKFLKAQGEPEYLDEVTEDDGGGDVGGDAGGGFGGGNGNSGDELYDKAVDIVLRERKASTSFIQRQLQLGYNKAANLIERMEREGIIGSANAMGKREVFGRKPDEE
jgi:S-DNA-T family DNA segregation ATPase FtsK/SpoIIIE